MAQKELSGGHLLPEKLTYTLLSGRGGNSYEEFSALRQVRKLLGDIKVWEPDSLYFGWHRDTSFHDPYEPKEVYTIHLNEPDLSDPFNEVGAMCPSCELTGSLPRCQGCGTVECDYENEHDCPECGGDYECRNCGGFGVLRLTVREYKRTR